MNQHTIDDKWAAMYSISPVARSDGMNVPQTITVLSRKMGMPPVRPGLTGDCEIVQERLVRNDRTLRHKSRPIHFGCMLLEYTMPMLQKSHLCSQQ